MKIVSGILLLMTVAALNLRAQEENRREGRPGTYQKILTLNQVDAWIMEGRKGETILARVQSDEFDPILELVDDKNKIIRSVDDDGSQSTFTAEIVRMGSIKIRVRSFRNSGGGRYTLTLERFISTRLVVGEQTTATVGPARESHHRFLAAKEGIYVVRTSSNVRKVLVRDSKAISLGRVVVVKNPGLHYIRVRGSAGMRYSVAVRAARVRNLDLDRPAKHSLKSGEMDVWVFTSKSAAFRLMEIARRSPLQISLVHLSDREEGVLPPDRGPDIRYYPVSRKRKLLAVLLRREGRYQVRIQGKGSYRIRMFDPTKALTLGTPQKGRLPVGASRFMTFTTGAGRLIHIDLVSAEFDPQIRLYNSDGVLLDSNDDGAGGLSSRLTFMAKKKGTYRVQIHARGNGGGGNYVLTPVEKTVRSLKIGSRGSGRVAAYNRDYWTFVGKKGQTIFLSVRSSDLDPAVYLYGPKGVRVGADDNNGVGNDCLTAVRLPQDGRYTIWITSRRGDGEYRIRLIDAE